MDVAGVCSREFATARPNEEIAVVARRMCEANVGFVVVTLPVSAVEAPRVLGVLTDRDIVIGVVAPQIDPCTVVVSHVMTREAVVIRSFDTIQTAIRMMRHVGVRRMPVIDAAGILVGVISRDDLLDAFSIESANLAAPSDGARDREPALRG